MSTPNAPTHDPRQTVSVVIPTRDEAERLPVLLARLAAMPIHEVVVVDGGSTDATVQVARQAGARVVMSEPGRARQLNAGAAATSGEVLWFLHADALPPTDGVASLCAALRAPGVVGGAFWLHTVADGPGLRLGPLVRIADLRSRYTRYPYGDQGLFCRRDAFDAAGGYPDQRLFEDHALSVALSRVGRLVTVPSEVRVSGRRFQRRPLYYLLFMNTAPLLVRLGVPPDALARFYPDER